MTTNFIFNVWKSSPTSSHPNVRTMPHVLPSKQQKPSHKQKRTQCLCYVIHKAPHRLSTVRIVTRIFSLLLHSRRNFVYLYRMYHENVRATTCDDKHVFEPLTTSLSSSDGARTHKQNVLFPREYDRVQMRCGSC